MLRLASHIGRCLSQFERPGKPDLSLRLELVGRQAFSKASIRLAMRSPSDRARDRYAGTSWHGARGPPGACVGRGSGPGSKCRQGKRATDLSSNRDIVSTARSAATREKGGDQKVENLEDQGRWVSRSWQLTNSSQLFACNWLRVATKRGRCRVRAELCSKESPLSCSTRLHSNEHNRKQPLFFLGTWRPGDPARVDAIDIHLCWVAATTTTGCPRSSRKHTCGARSGRKRTACGSRAG